MFLGAYSKAVARFNKKEVNSSSVEDKAHKECAVPFYYWLNERDSSPQINNSKSNFITGFYGKLVKKFKGNIPEIFNCKVFL